MARRVIHIEVPWIWLRVGLFLAIEIPLFIAYASRRYDRETIAFAGTVVGAAFALYSYLRGIEERRIQEAGRVVERWNSIDRVEIRRTMNEICEGRLDPATLARPQPGTPADEGIRKARAYVLSALNFYEELAIGIFEESVDEEKAYRFFASIIDQTFTALKGWIEHERDLDRTPSYYVEFQRLAERWRLRKTY